MTTVTPPSERTCERCGRQEVWSDERRTWVADPDGDPGTPHCLHEWDITGTYNPVTEQH
ncbi:HEWD family protein [Halobacteriales archaeon Cl-PHB]